MLSLNRILLAEPAAIIAGAMMRANSGPTAMAVGMVVRQNMSNLHISTVLNFRSEEGDRLDIHDEETLG